MIWDTACIMIRHSCVSKHDIAVTMNTPVYIEGRACSCIGGSIKMALEQASSSWELLMMAHALACFFVISASLRLLGHCIRLPLICLFVITCVVAF